LPFDAARNVGQVGGAASPVEHRQIGPGLLDTRLGGGQIGARVRGVDFDQRRAFLDELAALGKNRLHRTRPIRRALADSIGSTCPLVETALMIGSRTTLANGISGG